MFSQFLDPKNDKAFKHVFGNEKHKDILIHFLNDMIVFDNKGVIVDVSMIKTILDPELLAKKNKHSRCFVYRQSWKSVYC